MIADTTTNDELAGCASEVVFDVVAQTVAVPECQRSDPGLRPVGAFGDEDIGNAKRRGEIAHERREELGTSGQRRAVRHGQHDVASSKCLARVAFPIGHRGILLDPSLVTESEPAASEQRRPTTLPERVCWS